MGQVQGIDFRNIVNLWKSKAPLKETSKILSTQLEQNHTNIKKIKLH